jgi:hypothetical protein
VGGGGREREGEREKGRGRTIDHDGNVAPHGYFDIGTIRPDHTCSSVDVVPSAIMRRDVQFTICTRLRLVIQKIMPKVAIFRFLRCHGAGYSAHASARMEGMSSSGRENAIVRLSK